MVDPWYKSKRLIAAAIMIIALIASFFGYTLDEATQVTLTEALTAIGTAIAALLAVWSKIKEKKE